MEWGSALMLIVGYCVLLWNFYGACGDIESIRKILERIEEKL